MAEQSQISSTDRRTVLRTTALGVAVAGVGVTAAACSTNNSVAQGSGAQQAQAAPTGGPVNVKTSQVPLKSGLINTDAAIVVTQPSAGEYKAFTAVCTHQQCIVGSVQNNVIQCPCHGSQYSASTGEVLQGPATQALAAKTVKVSGDEITVEG